MDDKANMLKLLYLHILYLLVAVGCSRSSGSLEQKQVTTSRNDSTLYVQQEAFEGVLFTKNFNVSCVKDTEEGERCYDLMQWCFGNRIELFREATLEEILQLEVDFVAHFERLKAEGMAPYDGSYIFYRQLDYPIRQYIGYQDEQGTAYIWVNVFPPSAKKVYAPDDRSTPLWRKEPVLGEDGGAIFFNFKYNVKSRELFDFIYNATG